MKNKQSGLIKLANSQRIWKALGLGIIAPLSVMAAAQWSCYTGVGSYHSGSNSSTNCVLTGAGSPYCEYSSSWWDGNCGALAAEGEAGQYCGIDGATSSAVVYTDCSIVYDDTYIPPKPVNCTFTSTSATITDYALHGACTG